MLVLVVVMALKNHNYGAPIPIIQAPAIHVIRLLQHLGFGVDLASGVVVHLIDPLSQGSTGMRQRL